MGYPLISHYRTVGHVAQSRNMFALIIAMTARRMGIFEVMLVSTSLVATRDSYDQADDQICAL